MRILLDESLPRDLAAMLAGHEVKTVRSEGWAGIKNGKLLALTAAQFDVFITADRNIEFQQNMAALPVAIVVLVLHSTRIQSIAPLLPELLRTLNHLPPKTLARMGG